MKINVLISFSYSKDQRKKFDSPSVCIPNLFFRIISFCWRHIDFNNKTHFGTIHKNSTLISMWNEIQKAHTWIACKWKSSTCWTRVLPVFIAIMTNGKNCDCDPFHRNGSNALLLYTQKNAHYSQILSKNGGNIRLLIKTDLTIRSVLTNIQLLFCEATFSLPLQQLNIVYLLSRKFDLEWRNCRLKMSFSMRFY